MVSNYLVIFSMQKKKRKGRWLRRLLRIFLGLLIFLVIACFVFDHFVQFRKSDKELSKFFRENHIPGTIGYYTALGRRLRYVSIGNDNLSTLVFIHGSPASMSLYRGRFSDKTILEKFHILAIDRPGYGYSGFGNPEPSIQKQSEMTSLLLDSLYKAKHPIIVVGGSFGAPIACRLAMDHPDLVDGLSLRVLEVPVDGTAPRQSHRHASARCSRIVKMFTSGATLPTPCKHRVKRCAHCCKRRMKKT